MPDIIPPEDPLRVVELDETVKRLAPPDDHNLELLMIMRQALIMVLGAVEDFIGMKRTRVPRRKQKGKRK